MPPEDTTRQVDEDVAGEARGWWSGERLLEMKVAASCNDREILKMQAEKKKFPVLMRFEHLSFDVFVVGADEAQISANSWMGKKRISFECEGTVMNCDGELVLESTRTTEGVWETSYYVKVSKALTKNCTVVALEIEFEGKQ